MLSVIFLLQEKYGQERSEYQVGRTKHLHHTRIDKNRSYEFEAGLKLIEDGRDRKHP